MAIVNMKRIYLLGMKADQKAILTILQKHGSVEITDLSNENAQDSLDSFQNSELERLDWCIHYLSKYSNTKKPLFASDVYIDSDEVERVLHSKKSLFDLVENCESIEKEKGRIQTEILKKTSEIEELSPWENLNVNLDNIRDTANTKHLLGYISNMALDILNDELQTSNMLAYYEIISEKAGQSYIYVICHKSSYDDVNRVLKNNGFTYAKISYTSGSIKQIIEQKKHEISKIEQSVVGCNERLAQHAKSCSDLEKLYDLLNIEHQRNIQKRKLISTQTAFSLKGWIPAYSTEMLKKDLFDYSKNIEIEVMDPEEGDEPPVLLKNGPLASPFESVVKGFSYPSPYGIDPTAVMAPFFANFFGMMLSDAGYGLLMMIAIPLIIKKFNPQINIKNMMKLLLCGGIATVIWGALFNTWFGFSPFPFAFDPMGAPMPVMMVCIGLGAVHLLVGLGVAAYMNIKKGDYQEAIFSQFSWALLLIGLGLLLVPNLATTGTVMSIIGAAIILLTAGRDKKNIFAKLVSGFGALYGIMGWISDLLSYMRLFGMGLATGVIGMVINKLVGMVFQSGIIGIVIGSILFVGAHLFNFGINALGAYVHSCRLQYIEFFGKFYEDGGKPFMPLEEKTRYIKVLDNK